MNSIKPKMIIDSAQLLGLSYVGVKEDPAGSNSGKEIDKIQNYFGFNKVQYCALFTQYIYAKILYSFNIENPFPKTASSQTLYGWAKNNELTSTNFSELSVGDIVIWRKRKLWQGHVGFVVSVDQKNLMFETIEGNTANSDFGDQRDGDGIYRRIRYMKKSDFVVDAFWLRGFIKIDKLLSAVLEGVELKPL